MMARVFIFDLFENHGLWKMIVGENANFSQQLLTSSSPSKSSTSSSSKPSSTSSTKSSSSSSKSSTSYKGDKHTQINKLINPHLSVHLFSQLHQLLYRVKSIRIKLIFAQTLKNSSYTNSSVACTHASYNGTTIIVAPDHL